MQHFVVSKLRRSAVKKIKFWNSWKIANYRAMYQWNGVRCVARTTTTTSSVRPARSSTSCRYSRADRDRSWTFPTKSSSQSSQSRTASQRRS